MKAKIVILASVLLVGCQTSKQGVANQSTQGSSSASQSETGRYINTLLGGSFNAESSTAYKQDLWNFISGELKMNIPDNNRVNEQRNRYLSNKSYLHDVTLRAEPYMHWIVGQIKKRNMPMELVLLPIVESAFNPHATSPANAAGLWQIVPQTGRNYGLKQNQWYDGRRDVVASTTAALDILQRLNRMFDGDWLLTLAAYNSGEGRVMQAVKNNKAKGLSANYWSLALPKETSQYVPKMLALSDIFKHPKRYGVDLPKVNQNNALARVEVGQQIELSQAADMAGMSLTSLKSFNPGYIRNVTAPNGPHYIMVPKSNASQLKESLADGNIAKANQSNSRELAPYRSRTDETVTNIANRLNINADELKNWSHSAQTAKNSSSAKNGKATGKNSSITYRVKKGDSLYSIAKRHGVNTDDVMRWNKTNRINPGDTLTLYVSNNRNRNS